MKKAMKKQGFTLVEIMIVVAIIGLLAAIGIPSFTTARNNSRQKACLNNIRMIESGAEQHMMLNNSASASKANAYVFVKGGGPLLCPHDNVDNYSEPTTNNIVTCSKHGTIETPLMP